MGIGHDSFTGASDGASAHPASHGNRGLVYAGRKPGEQVTEIAGQVRARTGERDARNATVTCTTAVKYSLDCEGDLPHRDA